MEGQSGLSELSVISWVSAIQGCPLYIERVTSHSGKIASGVAVRGDSGVAGEGRVVGVPKFHSWGKCTMPLTNINSDLMSNASSGLCNILIIYLRGSFKLHLGV